MSESYTTLKGFNSISDTDIQSAIEQNLIAFFDWGFLNKGAFSNVRLSTSDIRSKNKSTLRLVKDPNFTDGRVWATFRQNLVWESGLSCVTQPINISGVYVNGSFKTPSTSGYQHYVDYPNGRVVFTSPISTSSTVQMEYSYKDIKFTTAEVVPLVQTIQQNSYVIPSNFSASSGDLSTLEIAKVQLPIVSIETSPKTKFVPYELGGDSSLIEMDVLFHILAEDAEIARKISNFIAYQRDKTLFMYDVNLVAASGDFALTYLGSKSTNPKGYTDLIKLSSDGGYRNNKIALLEVSVQGPNPISTVYHSITRFSTEVLSI